MKIIYEDECMLVCEKDAGVPVQTASLRVKDLTDEVRAYRQNPYVGIVHRLDQPVRGVVVFALDEAAAANLSEQAQGTPDHKKSRKRHMEKTYLALVKAGTNDASSHLLVDYLLRDPKTNCSRVVPKGTKGAKQAALEYESIGVWEFGKSGGAAVENILKSGCVADADEDRNIFESEWQPVADTIRDEEAFLAAREIFSEEMDQAAASASSAGETHLRLEVLRIHLLTGRHHQIRAQMAAAGMPIIGDRKYGGSRNAATGSDAVGFPALCAWRLELNHPRSGERMQFQFHRKFQGAQ